MKTNEQRDLDQYVVDLLGPAKALAWWTTPNPMFGNVKPKDVRRGRVYAFIREAREANGDAPTVRDALQIERLKEENRAPRPATETAAVGDTERRANLPSITARDALQKEEPHEEI